jgi:hypothetical protein
MRPPPGSRPARPAGPGSRSGLRGRVRRTSTKVRASSSRLPMRRRPTHPRRQLRTRLPGDCASSAEDRRADWRALVPVGTLCRRWRIRRRDAKARAHRRRSEVNAKARAHCRQTHASPQRRRFPGNNCRYGHRSADRVATRVNRPALFAGTSTCRSTPVNWPATLLRRECGDQSGRCGLARCQASSLTGSRYSPDRHPSARKRAARVPLR